MNEPAILNVCNLSVSFKTPKGVFKAVKELNLSVQAGKTLAIVGESGCGKSVTSLAIMKLLPEIAEEVVLCFLIQKIFFYFLKRNV